MRCRLPITLIALGSVFGNALPVTQAESIRIPVPGGPKVVQSEPIDVSPAEISQLLEGLFELGLPTVRGAKWVMAGMEYSLTSNGLPPIRNSQYSGNAWLVKEEKDGTVELIFNQSKRVRGQRADAKNPNQLPKIHIRPADLDKDIALLKESLIGKDKSHKSHTSHNSDEADVPAESEEPEETENFGVNEDYEQRAKIQAAGTTLLFIAHLHELGRKESVDELFPALFKLVPSPGTVLDLAVANLANGMVEELSRDWLTSGDSIKFAKALDELHARFARGWKARDAAKMLAGRLRTPAVALESKHPDAVRVATFLLSLKSDDLKQLQRGGNWLLPAPTKPESIPRDAMDDPEMELSGSDEDSMEPEDEEIEPEQARVKPGNAKTEKSPGAAFFTENPGATAAGLARLLEDHRFVRIMRSNSDSYDSGDEEDSSHKKLVAAYDQLPRPSELCEIAEALLEMILPTHIRHGDDPGKSGRILGWLAEIEKLNEEQLAWHILRRANGSYDGTFSQALGYLIENGNEASLLELREVFIDPAVWQNGSTQQMFSPLRAFIKRTGADDAFGVKVKAAVIAATKASRANYAESFRGEEGEEMKKQMGAQAAAQLKLLEQALNPRETKELLAELATVSSEEAQALLRILMPDLAKMPLLQAETDVFQTAATAQDPGVKLLLLTSLVVLEHRRKPGGTIPAVSTDIATRQALKALLQDDNPPPKATMQYTGTDSTVADLTASALVWPRLSAAERAQWTGIGQSSMDLLRDLIKTRAQALADGKKPPPFPDASKISAGQVKTILDELAALPPAQITAALKTKPADQHLALIEHLKKLPKWPPVFVGARLTVSKVTGPGAEQWIGKQLDAGLAKELETAVLKSSTESPALSIEIQSPGILSGLTLNVSPTPIEQSIPLDYLSQSSVPDIQGDPAPVAHFLCVLSQQQNREKQAMFGFPIWKDAAQTERWRQTHSKPQPPDATAHSGPFSQFDPTIVQNQLKALCEDAPEMREPFTLSWSAMLILKTAP